MNDESDVRELMRTVIRGESDTEALEILGITSRETDAGTSIQEPSGLGAFEPSLKDVAAGFYANWVRSTSLREWSRMILGANFIDLRELEDSVEGERVLEMLWTVSAGNVLTDSDVALIRRISESEAQPH